MQKVLHILGQLAEDDILWLMSVGKVDHYPAGHFLMKERQPVEALYILLRGQIEILAGGNLIAHRTTGDILGEISFVDEKPSSATVKTLDTVSVLTIQRSLLKEKLQHDTGFAARFNNAVARFLALRLREMVNQAAGQPDLDNELDLNELDSIDRAAQRFDRMLKQLLET